ncbi:MAG: tRNA (adenosine(37)-N6)-dimethylallyltransferase MiaA [Ruminococcaceae bacterium]|nr:tRNA (adenosine(37)-N6)-dimethylallyltransferase MiaA [Oscillospiraceae bacterium]
MKKIIAVVGPTASGKSALALELARIYDGEIVSCDSMQIYKYFDIGTAKPTIEERALIKHHMIDIVDPKITDSFSCAEFTSLAKEAIDDILNRNKLPILCGGTGLYIDNIIAGTKFSDTVTDLEYRNELFALAEANGNEFIYNMLVKVDPESATTTHPNNLKRVIRALEIFHSSNITKTEWDKFSRAKVSEYDTSVLGIAYNDREFLYDRINKRVDLMVNHGLINEVKKLIDISALRPCTTAAQAIGYKELLGYVLDNTPLEDAIEAIKRETRRYAKRQMTWFKRNDNIYWLYPDKTLNERDRFKIIVNNAVSYLNGKGFCATIDK